MDTINELYTCVEAHQLSFEYEQMIKEFHSRSLLSKHKHISNI